MNLLDIPSFGAASGSGDTTASNSSVGRFLGSRRGAQDLEQWSTKDRLIVHGEAWDCGGVLRDGWRGGIGGQSE
jgi:hypothetical protein